MTRCLICGWNAAAEGRELCPECAAKAARNKPCALCRHGELVPWDAYGRKIAIRCRAEGEHHGHAAIIEETKFKRTIYSRPAPRWCAGFERSKEKW